MMQALSRAWKYLVTPEVYGPDQILYCIPRPVVVASVIPLDFLGELGSVLCWGWEG